MPVFVFGVGKADGSSRAYFACKICYGAPRIVDLRFYCISRGACEAVQVLLPAPIKKRDAVASRFFVGMDNWLAESHCILLAKCHSAEVVIKFK